jgi:hypothetical protein
MAWPQCKRVFGGITFEHILIRNSALINVVRSNDQRCNRFVFHVKEQPQVVLDGRRVDGSTVARGKTVDLV